MNKEHFISLKIKITIGVIAICAMTGALAIFAVNRIATIIIDQEYSDRAEQIAQAVVSTLDTDSAQELNDAVISIYNGIDNVVPSTEWGTDEWNTYIANYADIEKMPAYTEFVDQFREYQDIYKVDCIYIINYKNDARHAIYIVDGDYEDACPPGCVDSFEDGIWPDIGEPIRATLTNEEIYGRLVTAGYPIYNNGSFVATLCVDISMNEIKAKERNYVIITALAILALTILVLAFALMYASRNLVDPVKTLSDTAANYCSQSNEVVHHSFEKLKIDTHDEIAQLLASMKQMETDMNTNINTLIDTKVALRETEAKANTMQELAVKDSLTGIRNKMAYDREAEKLEKDIEDGFNEFGLAMVDLNFLKRINDTYGHEKGNISIRRLCMLVCEIFDHSPVFRIGGDEFIVILKNHDYRCTDELVKSFNDHLEAVQKDDTLKPWEQISAAIGYYKFDKTVDKTVEDVFKKADMAMYERKAAMKAERTE